MPFITAALTVKDLNYNTLSNSLYTKFAYSVNNNHHINYFLSSRFTLYQDLFAWERTCLFNSNKHKGFKPSGNIIKKRHITQNPYKSYYSAILHYLYYLYYYIKEYTREYINRGYSVFMVNTWGKDRQVRHITS